MGEVQQSDCMSSVHKSVREYYGKTLSKTEDVQTPVCEMSKRKNMPRHVKEVLKLVHNEVANRYYGCGTAIPEQLEGMTALDLGSGSGRDCFLLSKLVGEQGKIIGLDMTDELLEIPRRYIDYHTAVFGFKEPNVSFVHGYIENLADAGIKDNSVDIIVSNCVVCLAADKKQVLEEAFRVLKVGGEMYFSDLYAHKRVPKNVGENKVLWGEGFAGALWWEDMINLAKQIGFATPLPVDAFTYPIAKKEWEDMLDGTKYASVTYRLFKPAAEVETECDVIYNGSILGYPDCLTLDYNHSFKTGDRVTVDGEIAMILKSSRMKENFTYLPSTSNNNNTTCSPQKAEMNPFLLSKKTRCSKAYLIE